MVEILSDGRSVRETFEKFLATSDTSVLPRVQGGHHRAPWADGRDTTIGWHRDQGDRQGTWDDGKFYDHRSCSKAWDNSGDALLPANQQRLVLCQPLGGKAFIAAEELSWARMTASST